MQVDSSNSAKIEPTNSSTQRQNILSTPRAHHCILAKNMKQKLIIVHRCYGKCKPTDPFDKYEFVVKDINSYDCLMDTYSDTMDFLCFHLCRDSCCPKNERARNYGYVTGMPGRDYGGKSRWLPLIGSTKQRYNGSVEAVLYDGVNGRFTANDDTVWETYRPTVPTLKELASSHLRDPESRELARTPNPTMTTFDTIREKELAWERDMNRIDPKPGERYISSRGFAYIKNERSMLY